MDKDPGNTDCSVCAQKLAAAVYDELDPTERTAFTGHLATHPVCAARYRALREVTMRWTAADRDHPAAPAGLADRVLKRVDHAQAGLRRRRYYTYAAAACLLLTIGFAAGRWLPTMAGPDSRFTFRYSTEARPGADRDVLAAAPYLQQAHAVLLSLENTERVAELDLSALRDASGSLVREARHLDETLDDEALRQLVSDTAVLLMQLANSPDTDPVDLVAILRGGIDGRRLILRLDLALLEAEVMKRTPKAIHAST